MTSEPPPSESPSPIERRLATILCADVAGYSRMMGTDEERTVRIFRGHREVFESLVKLHRGRIFNTAGDALLAEFNSTVEAVRCATEIQAALRTRNEHLALEERMQFRIGINLGDVIVQGEDLLGDGVNVAARIQAATEPGGICISGSVHDQIQNKLSLDFKLLGAQTYKNIAKPVRTYSITEGAAVTSPPRRLPGRVPAAIGAALAVIAGVGYWGYLKVEARRAEQARVEAQFAMEKEAAAKAQRGAQAARSATPVSEPPRAELKVKDEKHSGEAIAVELAYWESVKDSRDANEVRTYLEQYPNGRFAKLAHARIRGLETPAKARVAPVAEAVSPPERSRQAKAEEQLQELRFRALLIGFQGAFTLAKIKRGDNVEQDVAWINDHLSQLGLSTIRYPSDPWGPRDNAEPFLAYSKQILNSLQFVDRKIQLGYAVGMFGVITSVRPELKPPGFDLRKMAAEAGLPANPAMNDKDYVQWLADTARTSLLAPK